MISMPHGFHNDNEYEKWLHSTTNYHSPIIMDTFWHKKSNCWITKCWICNKIIMSYDARNGTWKHIS